jgi:hypothetical protein
MCEWANFVCAKGALGTWEIVEGEDGELVEEWRHCPCFCKYFAAFKIGGDVAASVPSCDVAMCTPRMIEYKSEMIVNDLFLCIMIMIILIEGFITRHMLYTICTIWAHPAICT